MTCKQILGVDTAKITHILTDHMFETWHLNMWISTMDPVLYSDICTCKRNWSIVFNQQEAVAFCLLLVKRRRTHSVKVKEIKTTQTGFILFYNLSDEHVWIFQVFPDITNKDIWILTTAMFLYLWLPSKSTSVSVVDGEWMVSWCDYKCPKQHNLSS